MMKNEIAVRVLGLILCLLLTLCAYLIIVNPNLFRLGTVPAIMTILILAVLQFAAQFICFINIWQEKKTLWNMGVFISTLSIIFIIIFFSIWIMDHLNYNMMPQ